MTSLIVVVVELEASIRSCISMFPKRIYLMVDSIWEFLLVIESRTVAFPYSKVNRLDRKRLS